MEGFINACIINNALLIRVKYFSAVTSGTDMLELDVRLTKDRKVVVFHDKDMLRLTGIPDSISDLNYDQLPPLQTSVDVDTIPGLFIFIPFSIYSFHFYLAGERDAFTRRICNFLGAQFSDTYATEEERRIPLLSHVFDGNYRSYSYPLNFDVCYAFMIPAFPTMPINIDVKDNNSPQLITAVANLIRTYKRQHLTVWGSFNHSDCSRLYTEVISNAHFPFKFNNQAFVS